MGACTELLNGANPSCGALKRKGGYDGRVYGFQIADLDAYTYDATTKDIKTLVMVTGKKVYKFIGKRLNNDANIDIQAGENAIEYMQKVGLRLYAKSSLEHYNIENIIEADDLVMILQSNSACFECFGLDVEAGSVSNPMGGLNFESGTWAGGKVIQDATGYTVLFSGGMNHSVRQFKTATSTGLDDEITYLDALL